MLKKMNIATLNNLHFYSSLIINYDYEPIANCESLLEYQLVCPAIYQHLSTGHTMKNQMARKRKQLKYTLVRLFHVKFNTNFNKDTWERTGQE